MDKQLRIGRARRSIVLFASWFVFIAVMPTSVAAAPADLRDIPYGEAVEGRALTCADAEVIRLYQAVFAREPDVPGLSYWLDQFAAGYWSTRRIADFFAASDEFVALYGRDSTNAEFVDAVYPNILGRAPDAAGRVFWTGYLDDGKSRGEMVLLMSNAPEFLLSHEVPGGHIPYDDPIERLASFSTDHLAVIGSAFSEEELFDASYFAPSYGLSNEQMAEEMRLQRHSELIRLVVELELGPTGYSGASDDYGPYNLTIRIDESQPDSTEADLLVLVNTLEIAPHFVGRISFVRTPVSVMDLVMTQRELTCYLVESELESWGIGAIQSKGEVWVTVPTEESKAEVLAWMAGRSFPAPVVFEIAVVGFD